MLNPKQKQVHLHISISSWYVLYHNHIITTYQLELDELIGQTSCCLLEGRHYLSVRARPVLSSNAGHRVLRRDEIGSPAKSPLSSLPPQKQRTTRRRSNRNRPLPNHCNIHTIINRTRRHNHAYYAPLLRRHRHLAAPASTVVCGLHF